MELETVDLRDGTLTQLSMSTHRDGTPWVGLQALHILSLVLEWLLAVTTSVFL
jgi:hypothetical protein